MVVPEVFLKSFLSRYDDFDLIRNSISNFFFFVWIKVFVANGSASTNRTFAKQFQFPSSTSLPVEPAPAFYMSFSLEFCKPELFAAPCFLHFLFYT